MEEKIRFAAGNISKKRERVALYARLGTDGKTPETQLQELQKIADQNGWKVVQEFMDQGIRLSKGKDQRPKFDEMLQGVKEGDFDLIMTWSVDRLGRSLPHLISFLDELYLSKVDLFLHKQGINTTTPAGKMLFQMLDVFSEFERAMIQERVNTGLLRARAQGKRLGRPRVPAAVENKIMEQRSTGKGIRRIANELRVGVSTVMRVINKTKEI
ncbi:MAG: recombinase family protein [Nitrospinota bacterium]|nr:recombinase family protein [Nitrospinota bacterium]